MTDYDIKKTPDGFFTIWHLGFTDGQLHLTRRSAQAQVKTYLWHQELGLGDRTYLGRPWGVQ